MNELLTKEELAEKLKCSVRKIDKDLANGLPKVKIGTLVRFDYNDVVEWYKNKE